MLQTACTIDATGRSGERLASRSIIMARGTACASSRSLCVVTEASFHSHDLLVIFFVYNASVVVGSSRMTYGSFHDLLDGST